MLQPGSDFLREFFTLRNNSILKFYGQLVIKYLEHSKSCDQSDDHGNSGDGQTEKGSQANSSDMRAGFFSRPARCFIQSIHTRVG